MAKVKGVSTEDALLLAAERMIEVIEHFKAQGNPFRADTNSHYGYQVAVHEIEASTAVHILRAEVRLAREKKEKR